MYSFEIIFQTSAGQFRNTQRIQQEHICIFKRGGAQERFPYPVEVATPLTNLSVGIRDIQGIFF